MLAGPLCCQFSRRCNSSTPPQAAKEAPAPRGLLAAALGCPRIASWILPTKEGIPGSAVPFASDIAGKLCHHDRLGAGNFCLGKGALILVNPLHGHVCLTLCVIALAHGGRFRPPAFFMSALQTLCCATAGHGPPGLPGQHPQKRMLSWPVFVSAGC